MSTLEVIFRLIADLCLIIVVTYLLSRTRFFKEIVNQDFTPANRIVFLVVFGLLSIYGTYSEVNLNSGAFINLRDLGPLAAGLLGGPLVGLGAGLIGGIHRLWEGNFAAVPSAISTVVIGLAAGIIYNVLRGRLLKPWGAAVLAALGEAFLLGLTLLLAKPFDQALASVRLESLPMILANAIGAGLLIALVRHFVAQRQKEPSAFWDHIP
jgi:phosphoserine phosphatase RsbU/P